MNEVLRQEKKFLITLDQFQTLKEKLREIMISDSHNGDHGYSIRSLYFDTLEDDDYNDKEDGNFLRKKIRLRLYDPKADFAMLEMKQKEGMYQRKRSLKVRRSDAEKIIAGEYSCLLNYEDPFASELYCIMNMNVYRPKAVVEYNRLAFIARENNIRVTFDFNIIGTESNFNVFDEAMIENTLFAQDAVILEVKFNGFLLSYIKDVISGIDSSELSVSKYCLSRAVSKHYRY